MWACIISRESTLIELTPQLRGPLYKVSIQNGGWSAERVLSQFCRRGRRCNSPLSLRDLWEPVPSVHSGLREIEEHYLFIFIHPFSQLIPLAFHLGFTSFAEAQPHIYQSLFNSGFAMTFLKKKKNFCSIYRHPHIGDIL